MKIALLAAAVAMLVTPVLASPASIPTSRPDPKSDPNVFNSFAPEVQYEIAKDSFKIAYFYNYCPSTPDKKVADVAVDAIRGYFGLSRVEAATKLDEVSQEVYRSTTSSKDRFKACAAASKVEAQWRGAINE